MTGKSIDPAWRITEISCAPMTYTRPRAAGGNARLGRHGPGGEIPVVRIQVAGVTAFGWSRVSREQAQTLVGRPLVDLFQPDAQPDAQLRQEPWPPAVPEASGLFSGLVPTAEAQLIEFPLLDGLGRLFGSPVYALAGSSTPAGGLSVPVYDTSIYFDDLDLADDGAAVARLCSEVEEGRQRGHRNFKVKVGRGAMWMDLEAGMRRDAAIVCAVRAAAGPDACLMADANNGFNLALAMRFLDETAEAGLYWMEEPFHEDDAYYTRLREWMRDRALPVLIADGEGYASPCIVEWAGRGLIDVLQYDLRGYGFFRWLALGRELDALGVKSAPHNYGGFYGNYAQCHLSTAIGGLRFAEWDEAGIEGIDTGSYRIRDGFVQVPERPGFGLELDNALFEKIRDRQGWTARR